MAQRDEGPSPDERDPLVDVTGAARDMIRRLPDTPEDRFRLALAGSALSAFTMDRELRYTWMENPALGYGSDAVVGLTDAELLPEASAPHLTTLKRRVVEHGESIATEVPVVLDQETKWYWLTAQPMRDASGAIIGLAGQSTDVTERKRAELDLAGSEARYRRMLETTLEGVWILDAENRTTFVNPAMAALLDLAPEEMIGRPVFEFINETFIDRAAAELALHSQGIGGHREVLLRSATGRKVWGLISATPMYETSGEYSGALAMVTDITARVELQERLEGNFDAMVQTVATAVEFRDPYTAGHQRRVADLSVAIALAMGLDQDTVKGIKTAATIHDLGKIAVPAEILTKPGTLNAFEFELVKQHAQIGHDIVKPIDFPWPVAEIILQHHERLDGSGYPNQRTGEHILPEAKIIAVADTVEAMATHRPYRPALGIDAALAHIAAHVGDLYDRTVVGACLQVFHSGQFDLNAHADAVRTGP